MTAQPKKSKPKSPPVPSRPLEDCFNDARRLYAEYSHGSFSRAELASALGVSSTSGPFAARLFSIREFGMIEPDGSNFKVSGDFMAMNSHARESGEFKSAAMRAVRRATTFSELLDAFPSKLPSRDALTARLETQKKSTQTRPSVQHVCLRNPSASRACSTTRTTSFRCAMPGLRPGRAKRAEATEEHDEREVEDTTTSHTPSLRVEIPVGTERKVVVHYPRDLDADEAKKVGAVLAAIVS